MVTASDGRPTYPTRNPLNAPATAPIAMASSAATGMERPASWWRIPTSTLDNPTTLATDRSISPVMMISVIGRAMSRIGAVSRNR